MHRFHISENECKECGCPFCSGHTETAKKATQEVRESVRTIVNNLNGLSNRKIVAHAVVQELFRTHPTLQQLFFGSVVVGGIEFFSWLHENRHYDLRCEASVLLADEIMRSVDKDKRILPFI